MVSRVVKKAPSKKASGNLPQIEITTPEILQAQPSPQIQVEESPSLENAKDEQAQKQHEEATQHEWEKLFSALFKINYPAQPFADSPVPHKQTERFIQRLSGEYSFHADDTKVVLRNKNRSDIVVEQKKIFFAPAKSQPDAEKDFDLQSAIVMARLAAQNPLMIEKGIRLKGSEAQIALLRQAIDLVNKAQPEGQTLHIVDDAAGKPAPQYAPVNAFAQSTGPQPASKGGRLSQVFATLRPETAAKKELAVTGKAEVAKHEAKKTGAGVVSRLVSSMKPKPIAFDESRRKAVALGAGAALAAGALLQPESADAAGLARGVRRERTFWENFFGVNFEDPYERRRTSARRGGAQRRETRRARNARQRRQEATRRQRAREVRDETRAQRAEYQQRRNSLARQKHEQRLQTHRERDELARKKREQKLQARRERDELKRKKREIKRQARREEAERRQREKQGAQESRKPDVQAKKEAGRQEQAEKNKSLKQQKREAQAQRDRSPVTGNEVILYNSHTGQSLRLNFNTCGDNSFCDKFNHFARDHHDPKGRYTSMDPKLQYYLRDIVTDLRRKGYKVDQVNVISGYRTVHTNVAVLKNPTGSRSQHCFGRALDIQIKGVTSAALRNSAENVGCDGIGLYSSFVHIDSRGGHARWFGRGVQPV